MFHFHTLLAASLAALALGNPSQTPLDNWADTPKSCDYQNATLHGAGNDTFTADNSTFTLGAHFVHLSAQVYATDIEEIPPTQWTLVPQLDYVDGWRIYATQPSGKRLWWYASGTDIRLTESDYSGSTFYMRLGFAGETIRPRVALWVNNRCLRFATRTEDGLFINVYLDDRGYCEDLVLQPVKLIEWKSSHTALCEKEPESESAA